LVWCSKRLRGDVAAEVRTTFVGCRQRCAFARQAGLTIERKFSRWKFVQFASLNFPTFAADCRAMRILALDHGTKRIGVAVSDETKTIAQPLEYILAEPFAPFLERLKKILVEKEVDLILIGQPRNMDGSYGPAAQKVEAFVAVLKSAITIPIKMWDERLTSKMANRILIQGNVRRDQRKEKVDKMAAAILLQSYLDGI
jgi:putative Holliday junction resolvase